MSPADDANSADGEGVWSPEIEQSFQEALLLFPPCGRRKHILQEEGGGKMYGRNELIARHIMMRTGKSRTRKQVSSHIQVLARRKAKMDVSSSGGESTGRASAIGNFNGSSVGGGSGSGSASATPSPSAPQVTPRIPPAASHFAGVPDLGHANGVAYQAFQRHQHQQPLAVAAIEQHQNLYHHATANATHHHHHHHLQHTALQAHYHHHNRNHQAQSPPVHLNDSSSFARLMISTGKQDIESVNRLSTSATLLDTWADRPVVTQRIRLVEFSAFIASHCFIHISYAKHSSELPNQTTNNNNILLNHKLENIDINQIQDKFPDISGPQGLLHRAPSDAFYLVKFWADINHPDFETGINNQNSYFGFSSHFETIEPYKYLICSTKACSYGLQVVEKVDKIFGTFNEINNRHSFNLDRSDMCGFMVQFIKKLCQLPMTSQMNSVLENFTVLQVITSETPTDVLLCLLYVFEVVPPEQNNGPHYNVYKLT